MRIRRRALSPSLLVALLVALLLAGCSIAPHKRPASTLEVPAAWRSKTEGRPSVVERDWWRSFGDPALDTLVRQALARNDDLRTARARLKEYRARITVANSALYPEVNASFAPSRQRFVPLNEPVLTNVFIGQVQASYEVDLFGGIGEAVEGARAEYASQQAASDAAALSVAANTASGYLKLRGLDAQLELARATLASRERSYQLAKREFEVGYSSRLELAQAESELRATAGTVPQLERAIAEQENALCLLIGASPGPIARGQALARLSAPPITPGLPSGLLRRRPDIAQAEHMIVAADAALAVQRDKLMPSLRLTASRGVEAFHFSDLLHDPISLWSIGGSILAPIFNAGRLRAQADIAASARDRAVFAYEGVVRKALAETEDALDAVERIGEQLHEAEARSKVAADVLRIAHNRHANGYASYLEELDAQRNAFSADINALQLRQALLAAHVDLYRALGGGWSPARGD